MWVPVRYRTPAACSIPCSATLSSNGEITPPCGVPSSVGANRPRSTTPALSHCSTPFPGWERAELAEKTVMVDPVECRRQVRVEDPHPFGPLALAGGVDRLDRVMAATAGPKPVGSRLEPCLPLRLQRIDRDRLPSAVGDHRYPKWTLLSVGLRDEYPTCGLGRPRRRPLLDPTGQLGLRLGPQRGPAVDARRLTASVDLRNPPNTQQSVRAGTQHQPLQTTDPLQVPFLRRREDPLPQALYFPLGPVPVHLVPVEPVILWSVHRDRGHGVQLVHRFQCCRHRYLHRLTRPASAPCQARTCVPIRPVGQDDQWESGHAVPVSRRLSAAGVRFSGHPSPAGEFGLPHSRPTDNDQRRVGPRRDCHVPHMQDATGLGALSTPGRRCSPGWIALSSTGAYRFAAASPPRSATTTHRRI